MSSFVPSPRDDALICVEDLEDDLDVQVTRIDSGVETLSRSISLPSTPSELRRSSTIDSFFHPLKRQRMTPPSTTTQHSIATMPLAPAPKPAPTTNISEEDAAWFEANKSRLNPDQQEAVLSIFSKRTLCVNGIAGTGKSFTVTAALRRNALLTCFTASVATSLHKEFVFVHKEEPSLSNVVIGNMHRILHISCDDEDDFSTWVSSMKSEDGKARLAMLVAMMRTIDIIAYDEIYANGTKRFLMFCNIIQFLDREAWKQDQEALPKAQRTKEPFALSRPCGRKQLVAMGDINQIVELDDNKKPDFVHKNDRFMTLFPIYHGGHVVLEIQMRQADNIFLASLAREITFGSLISSVDMIKTCPRINFSNLTEEICPILCNSVADVKKINRIFFGRLPGTQYGPFSCTLSVNLPSLDFVKERYKVESFFHAPTDEFVRLQYDETLWNRVAKVPFDYDDPLFLKQHCYVHLTANVDAENGWTTGTFCVVVGFNEASCPLLLRKEVYEKRMKNLTREQVDEDPDVLFDVSDDVRDNNLFIMKQHKVTRPIWVLSRDDKGKSKRVKLYFKYAYFPIKQSWAFSTKRSQGLSFEEVTVLVPNPNSREWGDQYTSNLCVVQFTRAKQKVRILLEDINKFPSLKLRRSEEALQFYNRLLEVKRKRKENRISLV